MPPNVSWNSPFLLLSLQVLVLGGMSSTTFIKPRIKRNLAERSILGRFESWGSRVISARNKLRLEFAGLTSLEPNGKPTDFKYELKYDEGEIETGFVCLYILIPAKSAAEMFPICFDDPIDTARRLNRYFQRPNPRPALVTNNLQEEI